jgi:alpha-beta hydrolase superfamily lysophospholipase
MVKKLASIVALGAGVSAVAVAGATAGVGYYVAHTLTAPRRLDPMDEYVVTPYETGVEWERVSIPADQEGRMLDGWWFPRPATDRVILGLTGYRGSKSDLIGIGSALWRAGYNVLLFDYLGHGRGPAAPVTLAHRELRDVRAALDYTLGRLPNARVGLIGFSMGAALAILAAAARPEIRVVIADSPFATHADVVSHAIARTLRIPGDPFLPAADFFLERFAGYRSADVAPLSVVGAIAPRPVLLIHGTEDQVIPSSHTARLYAAAGDPKELWIASGAGHCGAYFLDRPAYTQRVLTFFENALDRDATLDSAASAEQERIQDNLAG